MENEAPNRSCFQRPDSPAPRRTPASVALVWQNSVWRPAAREGTGCVPILQTGGEAGVQDARGPDRCSRERPPAARGLVPRARRLAPRARRLALGPSAGGERCLFPRLFQMRETKPLRRKEEKCIHQTVMIAVKLQLLKEPHGQTVPLHPEQQPGAARTPAGLACGAHSAAGAGSPQLARPSSPTFPSWAEPRSSPFSCPSPLRISPTCAIPGLSPGDIAGPPAARGSGSFGSGLRWPGGRDSPGGKRQPSGL